MTDKTPFANAYQGANKTVTLHFGTRTDGHPLLDFTERTYKAIISQVTSVQVHRLHDANIIAADYVDDSAE
jgi:hypothetical protein